MVSNSALVSGVMHFLKNHSVSQKVTLIAWYCTEICELFISVGSRFCAGCMNWITLYSVTYGDITEELVVVDKQYTGGNTPLVPKNLTVYPNRHFSAYVFLFETNQSEIMVNH